MKRNRSYSISTTPHAQRMRLRRQSETSTEREERLSLQRQRQRESRQAETSTERQERLSLQRQRQRESRQAETSTESEERLSLQRQRQRESLQAETSTEREERLSLQRQTQRESRQAETSTEREERLSLQRQTQRESRQAETSTEREERLSLQRQMQRESRQAETSTEREERLSLQRQTQRESRQAETSTEREERLSLQRQMQRESRQAETSTEREERLSLQRQTQRESRQAETSTERQERLSLQRQRQRESRQAETSTESEERLSLQRQRQRESRQAETSTEREERLSLQRQTQRESRQAETSTEREERLSLQRQTQRESRQAETSTEREERLSLQRQTQRESRQAETSIEREERLSLQRQTQRELRQHESLDNSQRRHEQDRLYHVIARQNQSQEERELQLSFYRNIYQNLREHELQNAKRTALLYPSNDSWDKAALGEMCNVCQCGAKKFTGESPGLGCRNGKVTPHPLPSLPEVFHDLFTGQTSLSKHFLSRIREYNNLFAMTSFGHKDASVHGWNPSVKIQGQIYHQLGSLLPPEDGRARYIQVYFLDSYEDQLRTRAHQHLNAGILQTITVWLNENNHYIKTLKTALEQVQQGNINDKKIVILEKKCPPGESVRRFNAPTRAEVAILMSNEPTENRDIVLQLKQGGLKRISELHRAYDPLMYPIFFPYGTDGYHIYLQGRNGCKITQLQFYSFHIMCREGNYLLLGRRLFQQFLVDTYCKIETERLQFLRREQQRLLADNYSNLRDSLLAGDGDPNQLGRRILLPATFIGGPRYLHEKRSDAMAFVRHYGRADYFITMTCNPHWPEIVENLSAGQESHDRPDIVARVFRLKVKKFMENMKKGIFGNLQAWLYTIEYQKRGLPHAHFLFWILPEHKIRAEEYDLAISAEIPSRDEDKELHDLVMKHMIHGPCGPLNEASPCMKDKKCSKEFPKSFLQFTEQGNDSYPKYRRRKPQDGGHIGMIKMKQNGRRVDQEITNQWVVPYNPYLLRQFNCHINVEICSSIHSIKYCIKYISKGSDQAVFQLQHDIQANPQEPQVIDEISQYQNMRYVSSSEAVWRILGHPTHEHFPPVVGLAVHLENGQRVLFNEENALQTALGPPPHTTLTGFFQLCEDDVFAKTLKYAELPQYYTWNKSTKKWNRRKKGTLMDAVDEYGLVSKVQAIGRIYTIDPRAGECYFLRLLLNEVRGPTSFHDLKIVNGNICSTFRDACLASGLLENDDHLQLAMEEANISQSPANMRCLFAIILTACSPSNPSQLWETFKEALSDDYLKLHRRCVNDPDAPVSDYILNQALCYLENKVLMMGGVALTAYGLPTPAHIDNEQLSREYRREINYDQEALASRVNDQYQNLTEDQRNAYVAFFEMVNGERGDHKNIMFLDAPGGTGKTFLQNLILAKMRSEKNIALATASSGIAATLLEGGRTLHSTFKVPLNTYRMDEPTCSLTRNSNMAKVIRDTKAIIVDEATMAHKTVFEAIDRTLQDIKGIKKPMGGIPTLLSGDFRQILPVVKNGTRANIVNATLKQSDLWTNIFVKNLTTNMRAYLTGDLESASFSSLLLRIGDGRLPFIEVPDTILIPEELGACVENLEELKERVYPDLNLNGKHPDWLAERAIVSPLNVNVNKLNNWLMTDFPGQEKLYKSIDTTVDEDDAVKYPTEFLNSIELSGMPSHLLKVKVGCPIMILRSLEPPKTTNGTRCVVTRLHNNLIEAMITFGAYKGQTVLIPRIPLMPSDSELPIAFRRLQFPVRPCFAMSINKSQGQTFKVIGIDLTNPCFSHGMFYVAVSRTGTSKSINILANKRKTRNVVYPEVLVSNL